MSNYSFDPAGLGWLLLGALLALTFVMGGGIFALWRMFGSHLAWALSVASRREIDRKLGTSKLGLVSEAAE